MIEWKKKQMDSLFSSSKFLWSKPQIDKIPTDFSKVITLGHYLVGIQEKKKKTRWYCPELFSLYNATNNR